MISQNQGDCFISKSRFCDITKYVEFVEFSIDEMMTPMQKKKKKKKTAGVFPGRQLEDAVFLFSHRYKI